MSRTKTRGDWQRVGRIHRALATYGDPMSANDIADLLGEPNDLTYAALQQMTGKGFVARVGMRPMKAGRPQVLWALTPEGVRNVPDPVPHAEVGRMSSKTAPSIHPGDGTDFRNQPSIAPVMGETRRTTEERWPLLEQLRNRATIRASLKAAALLLPSGDALRSEMLQRADALLETSPIEAEYLHYATRAEGRHEGSG